MRVGGQVQAANLIKKVTPTYPPLAKQARISGQVRFTAIIGKDGTIQNLQLVSGHPLLVAAARDAVDAMDLQADSLKQRAGGGHHSD